jgi:uncharacterized OB-fold protein
MIAKTPASKPGRVQTALTAPFWERADHGVLLLQYCANCGRYQFYPRSMCAACWSEELVWTEAEGAGRVWTFTIAHVAGHPAWTAETPYVIAVVELAEGPRMVTNIVDCDPDLVAVGSEVELKRGGQPPLAFTLLSRQP